MKTDLDALTILYQYLRPSALTQMLTGSLYKMNRPSLVSPEGSGLEDAVINALPFTADQFQRGTLNLNLYALDVDVIVGESAYKTPNLKRLNELASVAATLIGEIYDTTYNFWLVNVATIAQPETSEHYVNLRIDFQFFPTS